MTNSWLSIISRVMAFSMFLTFILLNNSFCEDTGNSESLSSVDAKERKKAYETLREKQNALIRQLINIAEESKNDEGMRADAMQYLGELRAEEAIPMLIKNIRFDNTKFVQEVIYIWDLIPVKALIAIGKPAVNEILSERILKESYDNETLKIFAVIIRRVEGIISARALIQMHHEKSTEPKCKENLDKMLSYL